MKILIEIGKLIPLAAISLFVLAACGGGGGSGGETPAPGDTTPPTVVSTSPAANATGVSIDTLVSVTLSEAIDSLLLTGGSFTLIGNFQESGAISYDPGSRTATFDSDLALEEDTRYTATITADFQDLAGNPLATDFSWSFTTGPSPMVASTDPVHLAPEVPVGTVFKVVFSEAMDELTIPLGLLEIISQDGDLVSGTLLYDPATFTATFTPTVLLFKNTRYLVSLASLPADLVGYPLIGTTNWEFTTDSDVTPPPPPPGL